MVRGAGARRIDALELAIVAVWRGAAFTAAASVGQLPDLDRVLKRRGSGGGIDPDYTLAESRRWAAVMGAKGAAHE